MKGVCKKIFLSLLIAVFLVSCQGTTEENTTEVTHQPEVEIQEQKEEDKPSEKIDEDTGLVYVDSLDLKYAQSFQVDYLEGGYKKLTDWNGRKTLLIPEGKDVPEVSSDINMIQMPINKIGAFTTTIATELRPLGELNKVSLVTTDKDRWHVEEMVKGLEDGSIKYVGKNSAPDFEIIEANRPDVILITTGTGHGSDETTMKLDELGINWISHSSQRENDPRGRLEWTKFMAVLLDKEDEAEKFYDEQLEKILAVEKKSQELTEKKIFASTFISKDTFYVRNQGDYEVKMFEIAGGSYAIPDLNPDIDGNTKMNAEEFYKRVEDADILFYNTINGPSVKSKADLIGFGDYLSDIKAMENSNVWGFKPHYYQDLDHVADMIEELYQILNSDEEITETDHFFILP